MFSPRLNLRVHLFWVAGAMLSVAAAAAAPLYDDHQALTWRVKNQKAVCVHGQELLAPDPYAKKPASR